MSEKYSVEMRNIDKKFGGVHALKDVSVVSAQEKYILWSVKTEQENLLSLRSCLACM